MTSIWERIQDWVLLAALLVASVAVMFFQNEPLVRAARAASLDVTARLESTFAWVGHYFQALDANTRLREANIELASEVARSREARLENAQMKRMLGFRDTTAFALKPARIVSKDITRQRNFFTIDAGIKDSVAVGMPVIDEQGILGKVVLVSRDYARVMSYLNTEFRVPAKVQALQAEGIVSWDGERSDRLQMEHVARTEPILRGQLVVTSGHSGVFPAGLPVGYIDSLAARPGRNDYRVFLRPTTLMNRAAYVFVILQQPDAELQALNAEAIR